MRNKYRILFWTFLGILFIVSSIPNFPVTKRIGWKIGFRLDYILHFLTCFIVGILCLKSYGLGFRSLFLLVLYAALDEGYQHFIPERTVSFTDFIYKVLGFASVYVVWLIYNKCIRGKCKIKQ